MLNSGNISRWNSREATTLAWKINIGMYSQHFFIVVEHFCKAEYLRSCHNIVKNGFFEFLAHQLLFPYNNLLIDNQRRRNEVNRKIMKGGCKLIFRSQEEGIKFLFVDFSCV